MIQMGFFNTKEEVNRVISCMKGMLSFYLRAKKARIARMQRQLLADD